MFGINNYMISQSGTVLKIIKRNGYDAYLVGGSVRDLILKKIPKDYDVITTADLKQIKKQFHRFPICWVFIQGSVIEVSSFGARHDEGKPTVISPKCQVVVTKGTLSFGRTLCAETSLLTALPLNCLCDFVNGTHIFARLP